MDKTVKLTPPLIAAIKDREKWLTHSVAEMEVAVRRLEKLVDTSFEEDTVDQIAAMELTFHESCCQYFRLATQTNVNGVPLNPVYADPTPYEHPIDFMNYFLGINRDFIRRNELHVGDALLRRAIIEYRLNENHSARGRLRQYIRPLLSSKKDEGMFARLMAEELKLEVTSPFREFRAETRERLAAAEAEAILMDDTPPDAKALGRLAQHVARGKAYLPRKARIRYLLLTIDPKAVKAYLRELEQEYRVRQRGKERLERLARGINTLANTLRQMDDPSRRRSCRRPYKAGVADLILSGSLERPHAVVLVKNIKEICGMRPSSIRKRARELDRTDGLDSLEREAGRTPDA